MFHLKRFHNATPDEMKEKKAFNFLMQKGACPAAPIHQRNCRSFLKVIHHICNLLTL